MAHFPDRRGVGLRPPQRGYDELDSESPEDIISYFAAVDAGAAPGHVNNVKGILFEEDYTARLIEKGIEAALFKAIDHPLADVAIYEGGVTVGELHVRTTDIASYIVGTLIENSDVPLVATGEVARCFDAGLMTDWSIADAVMEDAVSNTIFEEVVSPFEAFTIIRWLIGIPF